MLFGKLNVRKKLQQKNPAEIEFEKEPIKQRFSRFRKWIKKTPILILTEQQNFALQKGLKKVRLKDPEKKRKRIYCCQNLMISNALSATLANLS